MTLSEDDRDEIAGICIHRDKCLKKQRDRAYKEYVVTPCPLFVDVVGEKLL